MNWKLKAHVQNAVASLPIISNRVYFAIQRSVGGLRPGKINPLGRMAAARGIVARAESEGFDVRGKTVLEVGTGRMVDLPVAMWLCGAKRTITVDLNRYLSPVLVAEARDFVRRDPEPVVSLFDRRDDSLFHERLRTFVGTEVADDDLLAAMNIEYLAPADAARLGLSDGSVDLHVSHTVLEHIPADVLGGILTEARRLMRPGGLLIHNIDPGDHFAHDDPSITTINFLQFSDLEWEEWAGNQFMYHNRLRADDYTRIFKEAGVDILKEERTVDSRSKAALENGFPLSAQFAGISLDELATTTVLIVGRFV